MRSVPEIKQKGQVLSEKEQIKEKLRGKLELKNRITGVRNKQAGLSGRAERATEQMGVLKVDGHFPMQTIGHKEKCLRRREPSSGCMKDLGAFVSRQSVSETESYERKREQNYLKKQ